MAFRLSQEDEDLIMKKVDALHVKLNKKLGEDEYKIKKNDILVEALSIGEKAIREVAHISCIPLIQF